MIATPVTMNKSPMMAGKSGVCLKTKIPTNVINTIPTPDQIAYAIPIGMVRKERLKK